MSNGRRREIPPSVVEIASKIKLLILDVDGVLTDGGIILDGGGAELKVFHVRDGHGLSMLKRAGVKVAIITGRNSEVVDRRARELEITEVYQGCHKKIVAYEKLLVKLDIADENVAYIGDDVVDVPLLKRVGFPVAVADAVEEARESALFITNARGGRGAVREISDLILKASGKWRELLDEYDQA
ncbi:MAG TPA: HAD-IIIA family hydrolase [Dissulfurispiraceae bacterium]|nr:HAD-IIIA family hydrolase [Dissulfurispiraceae bacterium]